MPEAKITFNPHISVDCVIFGFDGISLKVLLIERTGDATKANPEQKFKLPGDLIHIREDLDNAAERILKELTGLSKIYLRQYAVFGKPDRIHIKDDLEWLINTSETKVSRVITSAYYSLIRLDKSKTDNAEINHASWRPIDDLPSLVFDHAEIIYKGIETLRREVSYEPICFELLPAKFTIRQVQTLYEAIIGDKLDNRNFRKKLLKAPYLELLDEKQQGVAHKPAAFYRFNREKYNEEKKNSLNYNF